MASTYSSFAANLIPAAIKIAQPLIKEKEGFKKVLSNGSVTAYLDPVGIPTIGWGTTRYSNGKKVLMGDIVTVAQCQFELEFMMKQKANEFIKHINFEINENQLAAMISFAYNAGTGKVGGDTGLINKQFFKVFAATGDTTKASNLLENTAITAKGVKLAGLVNRRKKEAELFRAPSTLIPEKKKFSPAEIRSIINTISSSFVSFFSFK